MVKHRKRNLVTLYFERIFNKKNALLMILSFFLINIYLEPVKNFAITTREAVSPWVLPFLLTDIKFLILFMLVIVCFFSDVPFMNRWNGYYLLRSGRDRWIKEQIGYIIAGAMSITGISILLTWISLFPELKLSLTWGKVLYTLSQTNASEMCGLFWKISGQYISKHNPCESMLITILIMILSITFLGLFMFWCSLFRVKYLSIIGAAVLVVYSHVVVAMGDFMQKRLAMFSPVAWMRIADLDVVRYGYRIAPSLYYVISAYMVLIFALINLICYKAKKMDFVLNDGKG